MNGRYYGKREIRWHSREKDRLEHIHNRKDKDERTGRNRPDLGNLLGTGSRSVSAELLADSPDLPYGWRKRNACNYWHWRSDGNHLDFWTFSEKLRRE